MWTSVLLKYWVDSRISLLSSVFDSKARGASVVHPSDTGPLWR